MHLNLQRPLVFFLALLGVLGIAVSSCSTKKNTFISRSYHNLTAHYNVYWNGMDNLRSGLKEYEAGLKDNYSMILPVYYYGDKANSGKIGQYADISIKKAQKTIQKHSMIFNRKEQVRWIDDAYLLMGKAYYYKQDYGMARRTFEFVAKTYSDSDIKWEAMLWMAMSNNQLGDFNRAEPILDMLMSRVKRGEAPEQLETPINLSYAQFFILQKNYNAAVPYLEDAISLKPSHTMKTRCLFILGQIAQSNGDYNRATSYYRTVVKRNPSFEMSFNAQINMAQCYDSQSGDRDYIVKKLNRMLKDAKNKDYQDQIYYALAQIALRDGDTTSVEKYLVLSVATSKQNNYQKAISSLQLADIYFGDKNYPLAQAYYDSTMQFLPKDYPSYKEIAAKTGTLTDLVTNLAVIQEQDSLQMLAAMPEDQRMKVIDKMISELIAAEIKKKQEENDRLEMQNLMGQYDKGGITALPGGTEAGNWYFYNPSALSMGYSTFIRKWGRRKLEDNWFLSDKTVTAFASETEQDTTLASSDTARGKTVAGKASNPKAREYYLKNIPLTDSLMKISNDKIIQAYYNAGFIYVDGLGDLGNSVHTFETLLSRFPGNKYEIQSIYELYQLYTKLDNQPKSDYYRNMILTSYPETDYAKLLINPDYYKDIQARLSEAENLYEETYNAFNNQQYYMVIHNAGVAMEKFPRDTALIPRFDYLRALSLGKIEVEDSLVVALQGIIKKYPKSQVKALATSLLAYLSSQQPGGMPATVPSDSTQQLDMGTRLYTYHPNSVHFYVLIVDGNKIDVNALKIKIADFNQRYFSLDELQVNSLLLDNTLEMVTVNNFDDGQKAVDYLKAIRASKYVFTRLENIGDYSDFAISIENYPIFYRNKNIAQYQRFFERNYPLE